MRTTLSIEDDVAVMLERMRKEENKSLKQVVNEVLRRGLARSPNNETNQKPISTPVLDVGGLRYPDVDNVAEVLAVAEREDFT